MNPFGIIPKQLRTENGNLRGYEKDDFADAFARYIPTLSATTLQTNADGGLREYPSATNGESVADKKGPEVSVYAGCSGVADKKGEVHKQRV